MFFFIFKYVDNEYSFYTAMTSINCAHSRTQPIGYCLRDIRCVLLARPIRAIMAETQNNNEKNVINSRPKYGGGPHGLGDPDDLTLRNVEKDVLIKKIVRDRTRDEKCTKEVADFTACCKEYSFFMVVKCRKENTALKSCLERWYRDDDFNEECKKQYLAERSEFRKTGIPKKKADSTRLAASM